MKFKFLQRKLMFVFGICLLLIICVVMIFGIYFSKKTNHFMLETMTLTETESAKKQLLANAHAAGFEIKAELEVALDSARTLADLLSGIKDKEIGLKIDRDRINAILRGLLAKNESFVGISNAWEPNELDGLDSIYKNTEYHDQTGRFIPYWSRGEDGTIRLDPLLDYENTEIYENGIRKGEYYLRLRETKEESAIDPYPYPVHDKIVWMATLGAPIIADDKFYGMIGVDIRLDFIQSLAETINQKLYSGSGRTGVVTNRGIIVAASDNSKLVGKHIREWMPDDWEEDIQIIRERKESVYSVGSNMEVSIPLYIGKSKMTWAVIIEVPKEAVLARVNQLVMDMKKQGHLNLMFQCLLGFGVSLFSLFFIRFVSKGITEPLIKGVDCAKAVSKGDLTACIFVEDESEVGILANALNEMVLQLRGMMKALSETTDELSDSSVELATVSAQMALSAKDMNNRSDNVASASEQITASVSNVASATERLSSSVSNIAVMTEEMSSAFVNMVKFAQQTSENVRIMAGSSNDISAGIHSVASSVEEMTVSLNEVAKHIRQANRVSQSANQRTEEINIKMDALSQSSKQIGKIVEVIKDIADQTNMLALNATIEAAGAGNAGKGFAVVASEIKELAKQSAEATDEIADQIDKIQTSVNEAVLAVTDVSKIIREIADINEAIAASAEEQTSAANEISRTVAANAAEVKNVAVNADESAHLVEEIAMSTSETARVAEEVAIHVDELARGVKDVAGSAEEAFQGVQEISKNIQEISNASKETAAGANQTNKASEKLSKMAVSLLEIVRRFRV